MENFLNYVYTIIMFVIVITIIEMLLPEGNNKKYVKLISSFLLTFIILTPIVKLFASNNLENEIIQSVNSIKVESNDNIQSSNLLLDDEKYVGELFKEGIKNDIEKIINENGYILKDAKIEYNKNTEGKITDLESILLTIIKDNNSDENLNIDESLNINDINKIKDILSDRYKINTSKIYIN